MILACGFSCIVLLAVYFGGVVVRKNRKLYVYNAGEYIDPEVIDIFEAETGIDVVYDEFETPEIMFAKLAQDDRAYDAICASDHIIPKLREHDMIRELDLEEIPNRKYIGEQYMETSRAFDPENTYTIPYFWGTMGILYNKTMVDEPVTSWNILWDEKYKGQILMQDALREIFMVGLKKNGYSINSKDPEELELTYMHFLGHEPSEYSNQLVEPEYLLRLLLEMNVAFGIIANLADDLRNLQRSEIGEVFEYFASTQVGSSTMPQKRNPWNSEHVKSLWKAMCPRVLTFYMDQISEHQRDLTNSASQRFISDYVAGFTMAVARMKAVVSGLQADRESMARNLAGAGGKVKGGVLAEPAYILLGEAGVNDGHEVIRKITLEAEQSGKTFFEVLKTHTDAYAKITAQLEKLGVENPSNFFEDPARYRGLAAVKSKRLAKKYAELMGASTN